MCSGQSIFAAKDVTLFFKLLSPIFLFAPHSYLAKLKNVGVDSVVNRRTWKEMLLEFTDERKDLNLLVNLYPYVASFHCSCICKATVLLATNVSFLAIQSVDNTHTTVVHQASYISILSSLGSIILGLLFSRVQHTPTLDVRHSLYTFFLALLEYIYKDKFFGKAWPIIKIRFRDTGLDV